MLRALYAVSRMDEWLELSKRISENYKIKPVYWICSEKYKEAVTNNFPEIIYHETYLANKALAPDGSSSAGYPLDKKTIEDYLHIEKIFYLMLNRHDLDGSFNYNDRKKLYYDQLSYWLMVIGKIKIDILILSESPHSLSHYIIYSICKKNNIKTVMLSSTTIPGLLYSKTEYEGCPKYKVNSNKEIVKVIIEKYIEKITKTEEKPWYMIEQKKKHTKRNEKKIIKSIKNLIRYYINRIIKGEKTYSEFYKKNNYTFEKSVYSKSEYIMQVNINLKKQKHLHKYYKSISEEVSLNKKYLYFPLHYQPERTSCPEGDVYADQILVIKMISKLLPEEWFLYVKEHPSQFMMKRGFLGRTKAFYEDVQKLNNVMFIKDEYSSFKLIDNSKAVVTLTGTAGCEAIFKGKPAFVFGYAWYRELPGVYYIETREDFNKALEEVKKELVLDKEELLNSLEKLYSCFFSGSLTPWSKKGLNKSFDDHVNELFNGYSSVL